MDEEKAKEHRRPSNFPRRSFRDIVNKSISILLNPNNNNANHNSRRLDHNLQSHSTLDTDTLSSPGSKTSLEFPGQRLTSISETSTQFSSISIENEIENFYKSAQECDSKNVPILLPVDSDNFLIEGYVSQHDYALSIGKGNEYFIHEEEIFPTNQAYVNYAKYYFKKEHFNFVGKYENNELLNFVLSIRYENDKFECIFRNKDGNRYEEFEIKELFDKTKMESQDENSLLSFANVSSIFDKINHNMPPHEITPIIHPIASEYINTYDKNLLKNTFTFGIIYQKCGQKNEKEILGNSQHSKEFDEFLDFIGQRICLRNFDKFRGMLDIKNNDTGTESVYEVHDGSEIMFHVSTMLPLSNKDQQNIERKRHIGNDRVTIIFQDSDTVFSPRIIKSKLLHVFMIIQPVIIDGVTKRYKISVMSKKDVPFFEPVIRPPFIFEKNENLKKFILSKLINAEYASLKAPAFSSFSEQTIRPGLDRLYSKLNQLSFNFTWLTECVLYNFSYLTNTGAKNFNESSMNVQPAPYDNPMQNLMQKNVLKKFTSAMRDQSQALVKKEQEDKHIRNRTDNRRLKKQLSEIDSQLKNRDIPRIKVTENLDNSNKLLSSHDLRKSSSSLSLNKILRSRNNSNASDTEKKASFEETK